jgi:uncharacterized protein (TIGR00369 family)
MNLLEELGPHRSGMEKLQAMLAEGRRPGFAETLDVRLTEVGDGHAAFEATPGVHLYNPVGTVHGGFAATMLDFAIGYALLSKLAPGQAFSTLELKVSYHRPMTKDTGVIRAVGSVVSFGRKAAFMEAKLFDTQGKLLASATSSLLVLPAA